VAWRNAAGRLPGGKPCEVAPHARFGKGEQETGRCHRACSLLHIGWMVLPEFQGRGLGKLAVRMLLEMAREEDRWGLVHAFPAMTNAPSNGICRSLGFRFVEEREVVFAGLVLRANHWVIDPRTDLIGGSVDDLR
jgi:RimJ/RimL family protein N-acetyltransferase